MLRITQDAGGETINPDRMWHYDEGIQNWNPIWTAHASASSPRALEGTFLGGCLFSGRTAGRAVARALG